MTALMAGGLAAGLAGPAAADVRSDLSAYMRARAADADGDRHDAAAAYATALDASPDNVDVAKRAYRTALDVGDLALATRARLVLERHHAAPADAALLALADAVATKDKLRTTAAMASISGGPFSFLLPSIRAWTTLPGDPKAAMTLLEAGSGALARRMAAENRPLLDIAQGRGREATATLRLLVSGDPDGAALRIDAAQFLAGRGETDAARGLLDGGDPLYAAYRASLGRGVPATPANGIARMFLRLAQSLNDERTAPTAIALARAAERLEPGNERTWLVLAGVLIADGDPDQALTSLDRIAPASPATGEARELRVIALRAAGKADEALAIAAALSADPDASSEDAQRYGDLLIGANRFADAAEAYGRAIKLAGEDADWTLHLQRGGALEQAGNWRDAEPELERAVAMAPNSAMALNYLGYARLEHGGPADAATKLIERASALDPGSAAILDSLGWGYFLQGQIARAVPMLEKAAAGDPANATINEHLGDAYWATGRRYEARYAWRAAAITASADDASRIAGKIADGDDQQRATR